MKKELLLFATLSSISPICSAEFIHLCRLPAAGECNPQRIYMDANCASQINDGFIPQTPWAEKPICHDAYLTGANPATKDPDWIAYHLTASHVSSSETDNASRTDYFCPDPCLASDERSDEADYTGVYPTYNRGHLDPADDNKWDLNDAYQQSFYYSNVIPQNPDNNDGIWGTLEQNVDTWAKLRGDLYIMDGPIYDYQGVNHAVIGHDNVWAPAAIYKIIYDSHTQQALAFIIPNTNIDKSLLANYLVSIDDVNAATGLNLFSSLPAGIRNTKANALWPLS